MKCSHGLPYEMKCSGCFKDAMERISASHAEKVEETRVPEAHWLGGLPQMIDTLAKK